MTDNHNQAASNISLLIDLEQSVRRAETIESLRFVIVNQTRRLIDFDQGIFLSVDENPGPRVEAISGQSAIERTSPFVNFVERIARKEIKGSLQGSRHLVSSNNADVRDMEDWNSLSPANILWLPLMAPQRGLMGILWLARHLPWSQKEYLLLDHLALTYAHGLQVFNQPKKITGILKKIFNRTAAIILTILITLTMFLPVSLTALGKAEIVPREPYVVTSPLDGVVKEILVKSNQMVRKKQIVARLDDTELKNSVSISEKALEVAKAQLEKSERGIFVDRDSKERLAELRAKTDLRNAELEFVREQLKKALLWAEKDGVAVINRPEEWKGRPVKVGEKILVIANPHQVELEIMLPVKDSILLNSGSKVLLFLDSSPLTPQKAEIIRTEYSPYLTELNSLSYRVIARFSNSEYHPRIGLRGTAKVYGKKVSLFYYLFRRPITAFRQWLGW